MMEVKNQSILNKDQWLFFHNKQGMLGLMESLVVN
jgi:hypothetical protein